MKVQSSKFKIQYILLTLIIILAAVLRLWQLGSVPASPDWDEAALGYNAYSILHTAKDEYGQFLPVVFRSFDDYKPGLYIYLTSPSIQLFGLSVWATRLPSAIFGILAVLGTFFLVKELSKNEKLALVASLLLAISPWHIQFSRVAFEANVGMTFNLFMVLFFLKGLRRHWLLALSVVCAVMSMYVYQSDKLFAPLLFLALMIIYWKELFHIKKKYLIISCLIGIILLIPLIFYTFTNKNAFARAQGVSVFADSNETLKSDAQRILVDKQHNDVIGYITDNRRLVFAKEIIANYLSHFDLNWLFITGDIARHHAPDMGLMYLWELPFLLIGLYMSLFFTFDKKTKILLFTWFLLVPIPAAVTTGVPHAVRTINFLPLFQIFTAVGIVTALSFIMKYKIKYVVIPVIVLCIIFNIGYYLDQYFVQQNYYNSEDWQYGYAPMIDQLKKIEGNYKKIVVSNQPYMDQSYMFFLFNLGYDPALYQQQSVNASGGFRENHNFGKFEFRPIDWNKEEKSPDILYIGRPSDFSSDAHVLQQINFLNGSPAMVMVQG